MKHYASSVWNLSGPRMLATGNLLGSAAAAAAVGMLPAYENTQSSTVTGAAGSATAPPQSGSASLHGQYSASIRTGSPAYVSSSIYTFLVLFYVHILLCRYTLLLTLSLL